MTKTTKPSRQSTEAKAQRVIDNEIVAELMASHNRCITSVGKHCRTVLGWPEERFGRALMEMIEICDFASKEITIRQVMGLKPLSDPIQSALIRVSHEPVRDGIDRPVGIDAVLTAFQRFMDSAQGTAAPLK